MDIKTRLKVFRYDPDADPLPHYTMYEIPWREGLTLLAAIRHVYETQDPTLGFRNYFCGRGLCASCLMMVDGALKKSCHVVLEPGKEYLVEPAKGYPVIRDLVVDFGVKRGDPVTGKTYDIKSGVTF